MERWQYSIVLVACLAITAPLEILGAGVYRRPRRIAGAVLPVAAVFLLWDEVSIAAHIWRYNPAYIVGVNIPFHVPVEEALFFVVIPVCALLTYNAVSALLDRVNRR